MRVRSLGTPFFFVLYNLWYVPYDNHCTVPVVRIVSYMYGTAAYLTTFSLSRVFFA